MVGKPERPISITYAIFSDSSYLEQCDGGLVFFDNEYGNCVDVQRLGVTCVYCPDGMTEQIWIMGLRQFQQSSTA
eukprot:scaffold342974_cov31-Prasinocladus_malaysianus.AAC.1